MNSSFLKRIIKKFLFILDLILAPLVLISAVVLKLIRRAGVQRMIVSRSIFHKVGVFPIIDHYYEPLFNFKSMKYRKEDRNLNGINFNVSEQLNLLNSFNYNNELLEIPLKKNKEFEYYYYNGYFGPGDAEFYYSIIRHYKPKNIIEVGSGFSTLMALKAKRKNQESNDVCNIVCIEPFENPWLEKLDVIYKRNLIENIELNFFTILDKNDILFVDSSHVIKPGGDVLYIFLHVLPQLKPGVIIHIHDIFTPKDYPEEWIVKEKRLWNEQYLLEAFLSFNNKFKVIGALNFLKHNFPHEISGKCPILANDLARCEPGSFWMMKV
ncbi:MAG: class I SAM-dependent methyltransferase [Desulfobaccales bacterium]